MGNFKLKSYQLTLGDELRGVELGHNGLEHLVRYWSELR